MEHDEFDEALLAAGVAPNMIRLSVGVEDVSDLINYQSQAMGS